MIAWRRGDDPFGAVRAAAPCDHGAPETHRKAQHLHIAQARGEVVSILVDHDQHAERDDECDDGLQESHAARAITSALAARLACASAASTAARSSAGATARSFKVSSITRAMPVNGRRAAWEAATATSLAAVSSAGAVRPARNAA